MKRAVTNADDLADAIAELETLAAAQKKDIQETFAGMSENLKPRNLVKNGARYIFSGKHKELLVNALIGLGTGFLGRKILIGKSRGFLGKALGKAIQYGMAGVVSQNAEKIKDKASEWIDRIFKKNKPGSNHTPAEVLESKA